MRSYFRKITGTKRNRPELNSMLEFLRPEDTIVVTDLTRLSRSTKDLIEITEHISKRCSLEKFKGIMARYSNSTWKNVIYYFRWYCSIWTRFNFWTDKRRIEAARKRGKHPGRPKPMRKRLIMLYILLIKVWVVQMLQRKPVSLEWLCIARCNKILWPTDNLMKKLSS